MLEAQLPTVRLAELEAFWCGVLQRACVICCWMGTLLGTDDRKKLLFQPFAWLIAPFCLAPPWLTVALQELLVTSPMARIFVCREAWLFWPQSSRGQRIKGKPQQSSEDQRGSQHI